MNDCDALDIRDFEAIKLPWDNAGIPIDWSFFLHSHVDSPGDKRIIKTFKRWGRTYEDYHQFSLEDKIIRNHLDIGLLQTVHITIFNIATYYPELLELVKQIHEPILTGHGKPYKNGANLWSNFLENDPLSSKFFAVSNVGIKYVEEKTSIVTDKIFKRLPPGTQDRFTPHYEQLIQQIKRVRGRSAIISTHFAHKYFKKNHDHYLIHVEKAINYMDLNDVNVVDVRTLIKRERKIRGNPIERKQE